MQLFKSAAMTFTKSPYSKLRNTMCSFKRKTAVRLTGISKQPSKYFNNYILFSSEPTYFPKTKHISSYIISSS